MGISILSWENVSKQKRTGQVSKTPYSHLRFCPPRNGFIPGRRNFNTWRGRSRSRKCSKVLLPSQELQCNYARKDLGQGEMEKSGRAVARHIQLFFFSIFRLSVMSFRLSKLDTVCVDDFESCFSA